MADILNGSSEHCHWAPLSTAHSLAIATHLQDQIRGLEAAIADIRQDLQQANKASAGLGEQLGHTNGALQLLQEGLTGLNAVVDTTRKDLGRTNASVLRQHAALGASNEAIATLREGRKVESTNLQRVEAELGKTTGLAQSLRESLERRLLPDLAELRDELGKSSLDLQQLRSDGHQTRLLLQEDRDGLRAAAAATQAVRDDLLKTDTVVSLLEQRLATLASDVRANHQCCADLGMATHRLREDLDNTKGHVAACQTGLKGTTAMVKTASQELDRTQKSLAGTQRRFEATVASLDAARQTLENVDSRVRSLGEGIGRSDERLDRLHQELQEVTQLARQVESGLNTTNRLVLPNLQKQAKSGSGGFPVLDETLKGIWMPPKQEKQISGPVLDETLKSPRMPSKQEKRMSGSKKVHQMDGAFPQNRMVWA